MSAHTRSLTLSDTFQRLFSRPYYLYDVETGQFYAVKHGTVLGRVDGDILFPDDSRLSRAHLVFERTGDLLTVRDMSTRNGSTLNRARMIPDSPYRLRFHDVLEAGGRKFVYTKEREYIAGMENVTSGALPRPEGRSSDRKNPWPFILILLIAAMVGAEFTSLLPLKRSVRPAARAPLVASRERSTPSEPQARPTTAAETSAPSSADPALKGWEAAIVDSQSRILRLRDPSIPSPRTTALAFLDDSAILARIIGVFGKAPLSAEALPPAVFATPELESIADHACELLIQAPKSLSSLPLDSALEELGAGPSGPAARALALGDSSYGPPQLTLPSLRLSSIRFPWKDDRIELASFLITCASPSGERVAFSEAFATPFIAARAKQSLAYALERNEKERARAISRKTKVDTLTGVRLSTLLRATRNLDLRLETILRWSSASQELAASYPRELLDSFRQSIRNLRAENSLQAQEFASDYEKGRAGDPVAYPPIRSDALLQESELLFLQAY